MSDVSSTPDKPVVSPDVDHWYAARESLKRLYGDHRAFPTLMADIARRVADASAARRAELRARDERRRAAVANGHPHWFARPGRPAYCAYVDRFGGTLKGCLEHVPYLQELNVGVFHPLPLLKPRDGDSDGGFAVADFAEVDPKLGTFEDLRELAGALRRADIALVLDVVCNHTAREHAWAQAWLDGDPDYADFYIALKDEAEVAAWSADLVDVFPNTAPGSFTFDEQAKAWVWTTFNSFQWDLNYANPRVFAAMLDVFLNLANAGVDGFRLDSVAYLWKTQGTICRNLPQTHDLVSALRHLVAMVAPGTFLLAEAIEEARHVIPFFGSEAEPECHLAYNNTAMAGLWAAMAERDGAIFDDALRATAHKPGHGLWLNYARCHDDIIWNALDHSADKVRQKTWTRFYAGGESFADGLAFQANAGEAASVCGMAASLCGVADDAFGLDRLKLIYSVVYALDGVPMIYMGDEIALANDNDFAGIDPDVRWLHRPAMDWDAANAADVDTTLQGEMFAHLGMLSEVLMAVPGLEDAGPALPLPGRDGSILAFARALPKGRFLCLANLSDENRTVRLLKPATDLWSGLRLAGAVAVPPWAVLWLHEV